MTARERAETLALQLGLVDPCLSGEMEGVRINRPLESAVFLIQLALNEASRESIEEAARMFDAEARAYIARRLRALVKP